MDLAWGEGRDGRPPNETGVVAVDAHGRVLDAGWTSGVDATADWMTAWAAGDAVAMVDAPLLVRNPTGMRPCEREVGHRYGRWKVSANCSNLGLEALAGVTLVGRLAADGWRYDDGRGGPRQHGRHLYEVYPYTTLVGAAELGYAVARPAYKRRPRHLVPHDFRVARAAVVDDLIERLVALRNTDPALDLSTHPSPPRS
ncbi:MAG: DUF429 domain-containing protein [Ilumatobacteraceae bacterium]